MTSEYFPSPANQNKAPETEIPKRRKHRDWSGATIALIMGLAGLFGIRLGQIWIGFDIIAQFAVQFLFLTVSAIIGLLMPRYKSLVSSVVFVVLVATYSVWPHYVSLRPSAQLSPLVAGEKLIKVASFNTFAKNQDYAGIIAEIKRLDADVITLVEIEPNKVVVLEALKFLYPYQARCYHIPSCYMAILSKQPLDNIVAKGQWEGPPLITATLGKDYGNVRIMGIHTTRFPHQRAQMTQINALIKFNEVMPERLILMGDFNATPFSRITQTVADAMNLQRLTYLPTWSASFGFPQLAIDHIFVSSGIRALNQERIGEYAGSDHYPISITLAVPTQ